MALVTAGNGAFRRREGGLTASEASSEEIALIAAGPARTRWPGGLVALGGLALLALAFYGVRRSAGDSVDGVAAQPKGP